MPLDSTTYRPATADPLDLDAMIAWLETMPAEGEYDYCNYQSCLLGKYAASFGWSAEHDDPDLPICSYTINGRPVDFIEWKWAAQVGGWTYGAALSRFKALREGA